MTDSDQQQKEDEVLKRMLKTPPKPFTPKKDDKPAKGKKGDTA